MFKHMLTSLLLVICLVTLSGCNDNALLSNLSEQQANQVLAVLQQHNIAATKSGTLKAGYTIRVHNADSTSALSILNQYQLPAPPDVQIAQAFPDSALVSSPQAEQARLLSMEEQRLQQSLKIIPQIVNARVHISYPLQSGDGGSASPTEHLAVLLTYSGVVDKNVLISQIKTLMKNSLDNILYNNISVVLFPAPQVQYSPPTRDDRNGNPLWWYALCGLLFLALLCSGALFYWLRRKQVSVQQPVKNEEGVAE
ncbi:type III secretion system inner membrane ring lipoprotein SctJ [Enterobacter sp. 22466]|uniref:type III secretion system inner membrane ring lipoprotein SctJ n=1 Tax=Enterobacter sp. 22466 TaxID=3453924 RepID=UPI003F8650E3